MRDFATDVVGVIIRCQRKTALRNERCGCTDGGDKRHVEYERLDVVTKVTGRGVYVELRKRRRVVQSGAQIVRRVIDRLDRFHRQRTIATVLHRTKWTRPFASLLRVRGVHTGDFIQFDVERQPAFLARETELACILCRDDGLHPIRDRKAEPVRGETGRIEDRRIADAIRGRAEGVACAGCADDATGRRQIGRQCQMARADAIPDRFRGGGKGVRNFVKKKTDFPIVVATDRDRAELIAATKIAAASLDIARGFRRFADKTEGTKGRAAA